MGKRTHESMRLATAYATWRNIEPGDYEDVADYVGTVNFFAEIIEDIITLPVREAWEKTKTEKDYIYKDYKRFLDFLLGD